MTDLLEPSGTNGSPKATEAKSVRIWPRSEDASSGSTKPTTPPSWFKDCQPLRIEVTPALVLVRFEWTDEGRKGYLEDWKLELRKLGRGVGQCAAASNLQRPVVLAIEESDGNRFTKLQKLSADQEWHRGDFALWPLEPGGGSGPTSNDGATPRGFEWLLEPTVQGLVYAENERSTRVEEGAIAEKFADELKRAGKGSVAALVERLFDKIKTLREEGEGTALTESENAALDAVTERWFDDELTRRERERKRLDEAAPAPALSDSGELPRLIVESYGGSKLHSQKATLYFGADDDEQARKAWKTQSEEFLTEFRNRVRGLRPPKLTVDAQCTPAAAMFVGSWFHAATRIHLVAIQHNQRTNTEEAWQRVPGRAIDLADLSSGQHAQMAVACVVGQNLLVAQAQPPIHLGMPHRVLLLDDVSSTYDLTNLLREAILWRQLAYTDNLAVKRQIFLASHHEDLTNQLLDHLVPPAGHSMRVLQFEDWSLEEGPTIGPYAVQPTSAHDNPQACKAFRERIEVLFDGA